MLKTSVNILMEEIDFDTIIKTVDDNIDLDDIEELLQNREAVKKNNEASKKYRRKKGQYLAELEKELCKLKNKNDELKMKELVLEQIVEEMRRRLLLMLTSRTTDDGKIMPETERTRPEELARCTVISRTNRHHYTKPRESVIVRPNTFFMQIKHQ